MKKEEINGKTSEPLIRLNMKQTAKGEWYGECTVRGDTIEQATALLDQALQTIKERSTMGGEKA